MFTQQDADLIRAINDGCPLDELVPVYTLGDEKALAIYNWYLLAFDLYMLDCHKQLTFIDIEELLRRGVSLSCLEEHIFEGDLETVWAACIAR